MHDLSSDLRRRTRLLRPGAPIALAIVGLLVAGLSAEAHPVSAERLARPRPGPPPAPASLAGRRDAPTPRTVAAPSTGPMIAIQACPRSEACSQPCFGAAARDPLHQPCENPRLAFSVMPAPSIAELEIGDHCTTKEQTARWWVCAFGPPAARTTFALIGDSHAGHWRPALAAVADANRWRGISITRSGCPFSAAAVDRPQPLRSQCIEWNHKVLRWFAVHPEVHVVFVSEHSGARVIVRAGWNAFATKVAGYLAAWAALPASVEHIVVIRDTPLNTTNSLTCVERALTGHRRAGLRCAVPRRAAVLPDPEVSAALRLGSARVQVADLTRLLCGTRLCYPVIGGVLVHKDVDHLTPEFSATLGPFLIRQIDRLMSSATWGSAATPGPSNRPAG